MDPQVPRLIPLAEANTRRADFEARPDVRRAWGAFLVLTTLSVAALIAPFLAPWPVWVQGLAAVWFGGWLGLFARIAWGAIAGAGRPGGWALKAGPDGLLVNLRSHLNHRRPEADHVVVALPRAQVRRLAFAEKAGRALVLEVEAWSDLSFAYDAVGEEARRWTRGPFGQSRARHRPVNVRNGRLEIAWRDAARTLRPTAEDAERALSAWFVFGGRLEAALAPLSALPKSEQEQRLAEMARGGEAVAAIALARELWGLTLTEAKARIDRLTQ